MSGPSRSVPELACHILDTGHCLAHEHILIQAAHAKKSRATQSWRCSAIHSTDGCCGTRGMRRTCSRRRRIFRSTVIPACHAAAPASRAGCGGTVGAPEPGAGRTSGPSSSRTSMPISCGAGRLPGSRFVALREAYGSVAKVRGLRALRRAFVPSLLPAGLYPHTPACSAPSTDPRCPGSGPRTTITATARCCSCPAAEDIHAGRSGCSPTPTAVQSSRSRQLLDGAVRPRKPATISALGAHRRQCRRDGRDHWRAAHVCSSTAGCIGGAESLPEFCAIGGELRTWYGHCYFLWR